MSFLNDFRYVEEKAKKTIIVRCLVSNLDKLFAELRRVFGVTMETQPAHITLYTLQKNAGIHINSMALMESLERVRLPKLAAFSNASLV